MVPGPRVRESRSPLDSRPPRGKPPGGLFFMHRSALRLHSRDHDSSIRVACRSRAPCQDGRGPLRFYAQPLRRCPAGTPSRRSLSPPRHVSTCRLRLTPLELNARGALSFLPPPAHVSGQVPEPAEGPASPFCAVILEGVQRPIGPMHSRSARGILYVSDESGYGI